MGDEGMDELDTIIEAVKSELNTPSTDELEKIKNKTERIEEKIEEAKGSDVERDRKKRWTETGKVLKQVFEGEDRTSKMLRDKLKSKENLATKDDVRSFVSEQVQELQSSDKKEKSKEKEDSKEDTGEKAHDTGKKPEDVVNEFSEKMKKEEKGSDEEHNKDDSEPDSWLF